MAGNVSFRSNTTFAPEGDCELDVTFKEPVCTQYDMFLCRSLENFSTATGRFDHLAVVQGSLGIVFGKFGNHNTVLIKELTPGCQYVHMIASSLSRLFQQASSFACNDPCLSLLRCVGLLRVARLQKLAFDICFHFLTILLLLPCATYVSALVQGII